MMKKVFFFFGCCWLLCSFPEVESVEPKIAQQQPPGEFSPEELQKEVNTSGLAAQAWLNLIDKGQYGQAWQEASFLLNP